MLDDRYHRSPFAEARDRDEAPLEDAVAMMVRERLTGLKPPRGAQRIVDLWRPLVEAKAGAELDKLDGTLHDQRAFAKSVHRCSPRSTWRASREADADEDEESTDENPPPDNADDAEGEGEEQIRRIPWKWRPRTSPPTRLEEGAMEAADAPSAEFPDETDAGESEEASREPPARSRAHERRGPDYKAYHDQIRRGRQRRGSLRPRGAAAAARLSRQAVAKPPGVVSRLANRLQRRLMAQQNRSWEFDLEEGMLDTARLPRIVIDPQQPLSFKRRRTRISATPS